LNRARIVSLQVFFVLIITLVAVVAWPGSNQREQVDLIIQGGMTLTMDAGRRVFPDGLVAIRGDRLVAVGNRSELASRFLPSLVINAGGEAVLPGLINGHTHAPMVLFRGMADDLELHEWLTKYIFPAEAKNVTREFVYWGTQLACLEMIRSGTTTFSDMYYFEDAVAEAAAQAGMRGVLAQTILDFPSPDSPTSQAGLEYTERFIKQWQNHPLITPAVGPHAAYTNSTETLKKVQAFAEAHNVPIHMHVAETRTEVEDISKRYRARPVEYLERIGLLSPRLIAAHVVHVNDGEIQLLQRRQVGVVHNPQSNMKLASGVAPVPQMIRANLALGLGTDGAASNNTLDMFEAMKTAALLHKLASNDPKVVNARQALEMATINGARALHLEKEIGSLEPGKRADLIIVGLDAPHQVPVYDVQSQLVYATNGSDVKTVIINGRVVMRDRHVHTLDPAAILAKANEFRAKVVESLKPK
jgi:5-methylthioadenosine/S-adenosylhomocysteine deaminase